MNKLKKLAMLCTALLATASMAVFAGCDLFGGGESSSSGSSSTENSSVAGSSSVETSSPDSSSDSSVTTPTEKPVTLNSNGTATAITIGANEYATASLPAKGDFVITFTGAATVTVDNVAISSGDKVTLDSSSFKITPTDATQSTEVTITITAYVAPVITLNVGANAIEVTDANDGTNVTFTATEEGKYALIAASDETNYWVNHDVDSGIDLPFLFDLEANATESFNISTNDMNPDTVDLMVVKVRDVTDSFVDPDTEATDIALAANEIAYVSMPSDALGNYKYEVSWSGEADFYVNGTKVENGGAAVKFANGSDNAIFLVVAKNPAAAVTVSNLAVEPVMPDEQTVTAKGNVNVEVKAGNSVDLTLQIMGGMPGTKYSLAWTSDNAKVTVDGSVVEGKVVNVSNYATVNIATVNEAAETIVVAVGDKYIPALALGSNANVTVSEEDAFFGAEYSFTASAHGVYTVSTTDANAVMFSGWDTFNSTTPLEIKAIAGVPVIIPIGTKNEKADSFTITITKTGEYNPFVLNVNTDINEPNVLTFTKTMKENEYTFTAPEKADYVLTVGGDCTAVATVGTDEITLKENTIISLAADAEITIVATYTGDEEALGGTGPLGTNILIQKKHLVSLGDNALTLADDVAEVEFITDLEGLFKFAVTEGATIMTKAYSWDDYTEYNGESISIYDGSFFFIKVSSSTLTSATLTVARDDTLYMGYNTVALVENPDNANQTACFTTFTAPETKDYAFVCSSDFAVKYRASEEDDWVNVPSTGLPATADTTYYIQIISPAKASSASIKVKQYVAPIEKDITSDENGITVPAVTIPVDGSVIFFGTVPAGNYTLSFSVYSSFTVTVNGVAYEMDTVCSLTGMMGATTAQAEIVVTNESGEELTDFAVTITEYTMSDTWNSLKFNSAYETKFVKFKGEANTTYTIDTTYSTLDTLSTVTNPRNGVLTANEPITSFTTDADGYYTMAVAVPMEAKLEEDGSFYGYVVINAPAQE